ncbi:MAG TPA: lysozyme inhibitor LprI family protein [Gemmatimonadaceae bacterium]|nr:lysozyme inhibitor LprI family protein [Gemmatimonadaceae bacterium]
MRPIVRFSAVTSLALVMVAISCRKEGEAKSKAQVAQVAQDTMLLHDLAEANKNTAAASVLDNSLNTVRSNTDGSAALVSDASQKATGRVMTQPTTLTPTPTNNSRLTVPTQANDAPHPTTVPLSRSPANSTSTRSSGDPCDSPSTVDQRYCLNRSIVANDAGLNSTYQDLLDQARKSGGSDLEDRFRQSQREWVNKRDSDCNAQAPSSGGKLWARDRARCLADYSARRTDELKKNLSSLRGQ